jgi:hypothetical protein
LKFVQRSTRNPQEPGELAMSLAAEAFSGVPANRVHGVFSLRLRFEILSERRPLSQLERFNPQFIGQLPDRQFRVMPRASHGTDRVHAGCPTRYWEFLRGKAENVTKSANNPPLETGKFRTDREEPIGPTSEASSPRQA